MLQFSKVTKNNLTALKPYFEAQRLHLSDFSVGFQFMWNKHLTPDYAFAGNCLILRELYVGKYYFHYPLSLTGDRAEEEAALEAIERECRERDRRLHFTNIPRDRLPLLAVRYGTELHITDSRKWRDYLYRAEDFRTFAGKRYSGQRNHINKFKKTYPDWQFCIYRPEDEQAVISFLREYDEVQRKKGTYLAQEEMNEVYALIPHLAEFSLPCGFLTVGGKIVALSVGERCGDMLVIHVEKALREYEGAYPMMAQQFACAFSADGVQFLNRMDDAGDIGLRKSKLQYLPCEIVNKYNLTPKRAIDLISRPPELFTERLRIAPLSDEDKEEYRRLASDTERNRFWGYDYRKDCKGEPSAEWFLSLVRNDFKRKNEMAEGIYFDGKLIGEIVLHRFGYAQEAEIGMRLLPEYEGRGFAREALHAMCEYAFIRLGLERVEAKCFRENERSQRTLLSAGMKRNGEDETYFYFYKTAAM